MPENPVRPSQSDGMHEEDMKILVISAAYPPAQAGEATNALFLCRNLATQGVDVHVLTTRSNGGINDPHITVHPIMDAWSWREMPRLVAFLRDSAPDAIILVYLGLMYHYHPMITYVPAIAKKMFPHVPFVTRYENAFVGADPSRTSVISRIFRKLMVCWAGTKDVAYSSGTLLRDSDHVIVLCERHRSMVVQEWPAVSGKTVLIPPPPNIFVSSNHNGEARRRGREKLGIEKDEFVIAFLGYVYPVKGIDTLLKAFSHVRQQRPRVRLLFIGGKIGLDVPGGKTYYDKMLDLARELSVDDRIIWTGSFRPEEDEASLYLHASDVGVLPFLEGIQLNNSSFSSMAAHALPMIVTRGPVLDLPFVHGENVLLCEPNDVKEVARLIMQLIDQPILRDSLRGGIERFAREWFAWDNAVARTLAALKINSAG